MVNDISPRGSGLPEKEKANEEPAFVPPDLVEKEEDPIFISKAKKDEPIMKKSRFRKFSLKHASKKHKIIGGVIILILILGGIGGIYALSKNLSKPSSDPVVAAKKKPPKTTEPSKLTGVDIPIELNKRPVTAIMIENSPDARPQAGLKDAGIVYEAIAEGGITRFNALFMESQPDYIGPVRSVRPYYIDLFLPFDASIVHAGGSAEGLAKLRNLGVKDIDHGANGGAFRRVGDRFAPHNLYTSMAELDRVNTQRGYTSSKFKSLPRKKPAKPGQVIAARTINISMSSALYNVNYVHDATSNSYLRSEGGRPHVDHRSGSQLAPKVVVALVMSYSQSGIYSVYQTSGQGVMYVFQDGQVQQGTWKKAGSKEQFEFIDAANQTLKLNPGQTWITLVKTPGDVTSAP